ncbi:PaaI family thioesterase [Phreatobacter sp. AB_2022a]|uniref:PaaI family thioesterase n=1 Tax=Phreatobacter sp. AB_2022a TaxID=3003134 RepID=UPI002287011D|nr:PaaI family thioesterase [Phreatobacter sp. AB_2022a]MCZ0737772.1 PaaI family thioesterase [Phreatobacter sp. AB_2022a]
MTALDKLRAFPLPFAHLLGIDYVEAGPERVVARLFIREDLCTAGNAIHGGAIMAFADTLGAASTVLNLPEGAKGTTTLESKTNFVSAAKAGTTVTGTTSAVHRGNRTQVWQTRIEREDGKLVALVTQTQMIL